MKFDKGFKALEQKYQKTIAKAIPKVISEAEPQYVWKNGNLVPNTYSYYF